MHFTLLNEKDFFNPYYRKKQIIQNEFDIFNKALMQYLERLESSQSENEDYLVANALSIFNHVKFQNPHQNQAKRQK